MGVVLGDNILAVDEVGSVGFGAAFVVVAAAAAAAAAVVGVCVALAEPVARRCETSPPVPVRALKGLVSYRCNNLHQWYCCYCYRRATARVPMEC